MDTLLRFKVEQDDNASTDNNKIASIMSKSNDNRTKEENETVVLHIIDKIIQKGRNKELINKIASSAVIPPKKGEVAELKSMLKL